MVPSPCVCTSQWRPRIRRIGAPHEAWGIDVIGPISPSSTKGHRFILAITDYFSKLAEAIPLVEVKTSNVVNFIKHHVIHRFAVP